MTLKEIEKIYTDLETRKMLPWKSLIPVGRINLHSILRISKTIVKLEPSRRKDSKIYKFVAFLLKSNGYDN